MPVLKFLHCECKLILDDCDAVILENVQHIALAAPKYATFMTKCAV